MHVDMKMPQPMLWRSQSWTAGQNADDAIQRRTFHACRPACQSHVNSNSEQNLAAWWASELRHKQEAWVGSEHGSIFNRWGLTRFITFNDWDMFEVFLELQAGLPLTQKARQMITLCELMDLADINLTKNWTNVNVDVDTVRLAEPSNDDHVKYDGRFWVTTYHPILQPCQRHSSSDYVSYAWLLLILSAPTGISSPGWSLTRALTALMGLTQHGGAPAWVRGFVLILMLTLHTRCTGENKLQIEHNWLASILNQAEDFWPAAMTWISQTNEHWQNSILNNESAKYEYHILTEVICQIKPFSSSRCPCSCWYENPLISGSRRLPAGSMAVIDYRTCRLMECIHGLMSGKKVKERSAW